MWSLKFRAIEKWNPYNKRCLKFSVKIYFYSHNYYEKDNKLFFVGSGILEGKEKNKEKFLLDLKKDKKVSFLEFNKGFFTCIYSELKTAERSEKVLVAYNSKLIFLKPAIFDENGWEQWEIACPERKNLQRFIEVIEENNAEHKLFYLKKSKLNNMMIYSMVPKLTDKQEKALSSAVKEGYYGYPRKITLKKLAKIANISISTFQFHLAKAEAKLLPFLVKKR